VKPRTFVITNLAGCGVLTVLLIVQWLYNSGLREKLTESYKETARIEEERQTQTARADGLDQDLTNLKTSVESVNREVLSLQTDLDHKKEEADHLRADLDVAKKGLEEWQAGVTQRDERIAEMEKSIGLYKTRLDEAIARLTKAAAERKAQH
jgi:chromosome segregation ATPase